MKGFNLIHGIAECEKCDWSSGDYKGNITHLARQHAKKFNHTVNVELGFHKRIVGDEK